MSEPSQVSISLAGKVALVTGGSRGIGAAVVRLFRRAGARVAFSYRTSRDQAEALARECGEQDSAAIGVDHAEPSAGDELVERAVSRFGRLDLAVVNHGVWFADDRLVEQIPDAQWRRTIGVNLDGVFAVTRSVVVQMKKQPASGAERGAIVVVSSSSAQQGEPFHADYAASKGALVSFVKSLAGELGPERIRINCVAPGWVDTEMVASALDDPGQREAILAGSPMGRVARPDEVAGPILFLCSPHAGFIHGEVLNINGGACLAG